MSVKTALEEDLPQMARICDVAVFVLVVNLTEIENRVKRAMSVAELQPAGVDLQQQRARTKSGGNLKETIISR